MVHKYIYIYSSFSLSQLLPVNSTISLSFAANLMRICLEKSRERGRKSVAMRGRVEKLAEKLKLFAVLRIFA